MMKAIIIGCGDRGRRYAQYSLNHPDEMEIAAIAEPVDAKVQYMKDLHKLQDNQIYSDWREIAEKPRFADFVVISTQDAMHCEPALAFIDKGYNILLEKPMAPVPEECKKITEAAEKKGVKVVVCHVLRFTKFWYKIKEMIDNGDVGEIMSIIHMENVGNLHQSHSFVRGNWSRAEDSAPMILAKSCHDTDLVQWLIGKECKKVQSFGSLTHFNKENKPEGAPHRCTDNCPYYDSCYYNAVWQYCVCTESDSVGRRVVVANKMNPTDEEVMEALRTGPYGRCVYDCDNDVVDHQVVNMEFDGGATVSFTMNAFNKGGRFMRIFGTKGEIYADMETNKIEYFSFDTRETTEIQMEQIGQHIDSGHGGGDTGIVRDCLKYFSNQTPSKSVCSTRVSYLSHRIAFAAEKSRLSGEVIDLGKYSAEL